MRRGDRTRFRADGSLDLRRPGAEARGLLTARKTADVRQVPRSVNEYSCVSTTVTSIDRRHCVARPLGTVSFQRTLYVGRASSVRVGIGNDPSAGSPTETLLRLLLPLDDQV
jgi:hypothetical protein